MRDLINGAARRMPEWPLYFLGAVPPAYLVWLLFQGGLGADPVRALEHRLGLWGLQLLLASLCITPLLRFARVNLMRFRRPLGVMGGLYIVLHFAVWLLLDLQLRWGEIWADLTKRPYIIVGTVALVLLLPLLATSTKGAMRRLGALRWRKLHQLSYAVVLLGAVHFVMQEKVWSLELLIHVGLSALLVLLRVHWRYGWR